jgi:nitric oxide reductase subunit C
VQATGRRRLFSILIAVFFLQTWLVYSDSQTRRTPPLSKLAARGQEIWLDNNCQSCHQVFGFGGFLGPDLTNAIGSLTDARLDSILTEGAGLMPAFQLDAEERGALKQWFVELDRVGVGVPRLAPRLPVGELLDHLLTKVAKPLTEQEANGLAVVKKQVCITCHLPNLATATVGGPDLTTAIERLGESKVRAVLANGVPGTVMPKFGFSDRQLDEVVAYLAWLGRHRDQAQRVFEVTRPGDGWSLRDVPWFEYD